MRPHTLACAAVLIVVLLAVGLAVAREKNVYEFPGGKRGQNPQGGVISDSAGNLYGTTYYGGIYGWGTVYELERTKNGWKERVLYSFAGVADGTNPVGNLLIDTAGNLYGTTEYGGTGTGCQQGSYGCGGTAFELVQSDRVWKHIILYSFCASSGCSDGSDPSGLTFDGAGNLYGTTVYGGQGCDSGCGTVYALSRSGDLWAETVLHEFSSNTGDGFFAAPGVTLDRTGNIYGSTYGGGEFNRGIVFKLKANKRGWNEVILYSFTGNGLDLGSNGSLIFDSAGNLIGTADGGFGTIFELSHVRQRWKEKILFAFGGSNGAMPNPGLVADQAGDFYGSCLQGGKNNAGVVFKLKPGKESKLTILYSFPGQSADGFPNPGLIFGPGGGLYGTTPSDSSGQYDGTVFDVSP